jgi:hypothetical protein
MLESMTEVLRVLPRSVDSVALAASIRSVEQSRADATPRP